METIVRMMLIDALAMIEEDTDITVKIHDEQFEGDGTCTIYHGACKNYPFMVLKYLWHTVEEFGMDDESLTILLMEDKDDDRNDAV